MVKNAATICLIQPYRLYLQIIRTGRGHPCSRFNPLRRILPIDYIFYIMAKNFLFLICVLITAAMPLPSAASETHRQLIIDSLQQKVLPKVTNPDDSIKILYDIFDLSPRNKHNTIAKAIYDIARRQENFDVQLDIIRLLVANNLRSDSAMNALYRKAELMPASDDRSETLLFIYINKMSQKIRKAKESDRQEQLRQQITLYHQDLKDSLDLYQRIERLWTLCLYLGQTSESDVFMRYMNTLNSLIEQLPPSKSNALSNMFFVQTAMGASTVEDHETAVKADKRLLEIIEDLKRNYAKKGRRYRQYDIQEYLCYRRLLSNFEALAPSEEKKFYEKIQELAENNEEIRADINTNRRVDIYYSMANKEYDKAHRLLLEQAYADRNRPYRRKLIKYLTTTSQATGDTRTLNDAYKEYTRILEDYIKTQATNKYRELQIVYDIANIQRENEQLARDKQQSELDLNRRIVIIVLVMLGVMIVLIIVMFRMYSHARKIARTLEKSQSKLQKEKERLLHTQQDLIVARSQAESANRMKTQFFQNITHEIRTPLNAIVGFSQLIIYNIPPEKQEQMEEYIKIINSNNNMLTSLINDVLDITQLEAGELHLNKKPESADALCRMAVNSSRAMLKPGVTMEFIPGPQDVSIYTDAQRSAQILGNLLNNAAKFTEAGSITLRYYVEEERKEIVFEVTDSGCGIPVEMSEEIFERFVKVNDYTLGAGLGLHICRLLARMLGGTVILDKAYTEGARFLFIHPLKNPNPIID